MVELEKLGIFACALDMPNAFAPVCNEWIEEIARHVDRSKNDELYLVGHSLGSTAILRYLESASDSFQASGIILVSGPIRKVQNKKIEDFLEREFDFASIRSKAKNRVVIHGDNDQWVPVDHAKTAAKELQGELILVSNGGHLDGSSGWHTLPQCLDALKKMME